MSSSEDASSFYDAHQQHALNGTLKRLLSQLAQRRPPCDLPVSPPPGRHVHTSCLCCSGCRVSSGRECLPWARCTCPFHPDSPAPLKRGLGFPSGVSRRNVCWNLCSSEKAVGPWDGDQATVGTHSALTFGYYGAWLPVVAQGCSVTQFRLILPIGGSPSRPS